MWAALGAADAYAGSLVVGPVDAVSDNSIRFHERTCFLAELSLKSPLFFLAIIFGCERARCRSQPIRLQGLLWIRRQTGRLSGLEATIYTIMVALRWTDCFGWRTAWGWFSSRLAMHDDVVVQGFWSLVVKLRLTMCAVCPNIEGSLIDFSEKQTTTHIRTLLGLRHHGTHARRRRCDM